MKSSADPPTRPTTDRAVLATKIGRAMADGRWDDVLEALSPDVVAHVPAVGDLHGVDALAGFLLETAAKTDDGEHLELLDALAGESHVALYFRITATRADRAPLDNLTVHLARLDGDRIAEIWFHNFDGQTVAAFWA
ncbi:MAG: nuclear transport factor 2 family protein [Actinomycetota bacterium]